MIEDRELLWKAWPTGFLAVPGCGTVGGYRCSWVVKRRAEWRCADNTTGPQVTFSPRLKSGPKTQPVNIGALLPAVDPSDMATWASLTHELAVATGLRFDVGDAVVLQPLPASGQTDPPGWKSWWLIVIGAWEAAGYIAPEEHGDGRHSHVRWHRFDFDRPILDPAMALVLARIQARERFGR